MRKHSNQPQKIVDAVEAYDSLAPYYGEIAARRSRYLDAVEKIVVANSYGATSLLDIGAGDAVRTTRIARAAKIHHVVVVEPSARMSSQVPPGMQVWKCRASEISDTGNRFEVITCLWNVLGHMRSTEERIRSLAKAGSLLTRTGALFLDVNHRHNAAAYGWPVTALNILRDHLSRSDKHGDVIVTWEVGGQPIRTRGHLFVQRELKAIFQKAGLFIDKRWILNYATGAACRFSFQGNLLYRLTAHHRHGPEVTVTEARQR